MRRLTPIAPLALAVLACAPATNVTPEPAPVQAAESEGTTAPAAAPALAPAPATVDDDAPTGLAAAVQGLWSLELRGVPDEGKPFWLFSGNRVTALRLQGGRLVEEGSDNFRVLDDCRSRTFDPGGSSLDIGPGVFGPGNGMALCWTLLRVDSDSLVYSAMEDVVRLDRRDMAMLDTQPAANTSPLQGRWQSLDDPKAGLVITDTQMGDSYQGFDARMDSYSRVAACPTGPMAEAPGAYIVRDAGEGEVFCYRIIAADSRTLELVPDTGRGNTLRFQRAD